MPFSRHIFAGLAAVFDRELPEGDVADGAADRDRGRKPHGADADHAGEQDEHLNGAGGGSRHGTSTAMMPLRCSDAIARSISRP